MDLAAPPSKARVARYRVSMLHFASHYSVYNQVDSPAQLANELVNITDNSEEVMSEDVSLTVVLLDTVTNSTEDLQQEEVSNYSYIYYQLHCGHSTSVIISCWLALYQHCMYIIGTNGHSFNCK